MLLLLDAHVINFNLLYMFFSWSVFTSCIHIYYNLYITLLFLAVNFLPYILSFSWMLSIFYSSTCSQCL